MKKTIRQNMSLIIFGAVALVLAFLPIMGVRQIWLLYLIYFFIFLAAANMWNLLAGFSGLLALCPAAFIGLAAYIMTILTWVEIPFYVGMLVGSAASALFAIVISPSVFRMKGIYFAIGTLVVPEILRLVFLRWIPVGGDFHGGGAGYIVKGLSGVSMEDVYWLGLGLSVASIILIRLILRSKFGFGLAAIRDNDVSAAGLGIDVFRIKLYSFVIGAFVMGAAGSLFYTYQAYIEPNSAFSIRWLMTVLLATVIGGIGKEWGPLVGTFIVVILHFQLARYGEINLLIQGIILVVIMLAAPNGILGFITDLGKKRDLQTLSQLPTKG